MHALKNIDLTDARRAFLSRSALGLGSVALAGLLPPDKVRAAAPTPSYAGLSDLPHFAPRAKRVIFLCMAGGPSHLETFDYKEQLEKMHGKPMPKSVTEGQPIAQLQGKRNNLTCLGPQHDFEKFGKSGQHICKLFPHCLLYTSPSPRD